MPVRSTTLGAGIVSGGQVVSIFTVPPDTTVLVKSVSWFYGNPTADMLVLLATLPPAAGLVLTTIPLTQNAAGYKDVWWAFDPGWKLELQGASAGATHYFISGTWLPGAAPQPPGMKPVDV